MKIWLILGLIALVGIYHFVGYHFGITGKAWALGFLILASIGSSIAIWILRRRLKSDIANMSEDQQAAFLEAVPDISEPDGFEYRWQFKLTDGVVGILFAFLPPILLSVIKGDALSLNTDFTGFHLLAMASGIGIYIAIRHFVIVRLRRHELEFPEASGEEK